MCLNTCSVGIRPGVRCQGSCTLRPAARRASLRAPTLLCAIAQHFSSEEHHVQTSPGSHRPGQLFELRIVAKEDAEDGSTTDTPRFLVEFPALIDGAHVRVRCRKARIYLGRVLPRALSPDAPCIRAAIYISLKRGREASKNHFQQCIFPISDTCRITR